MLSPMDPLEAALANTILILAFDLDLEPCSAFLGPSENARMNLDDISY